MVHADRIRAGLKLDDTIVAGIVCSDRLLRVGPIVAHHDLRFCNYGAVGIKHGSTDCAVGSGLGREQRAEHGNKQRQHQHPLHEIYKTWHHYFPPLEIRTWQWILGKLKGTIIIAKMRNASREYPQE